MNETQQAQSFGVLDRLIGVSEAISEIRSLVRRVAETKISVLIDGESGTGKDIVARMIHDLSPRRDKDFIPVNCGAIPEGLFESEMFGHERGSFTGAERQHKGYFERADGGTLFLDEVGEMPLNMQVKVLRALESGEYFRVGGKQPLKADVHVIAATNRDLRQAIQKKNFREDLYFRLRAVEIHIPPLRERSEDIPPLVDRFIDEFCHENQIERPRIYPDAMKTLQNQYWGGNVRELKHFIGTLLALERETHLDSEAIRRHLPRPHKNDEAALRLPVISQIPRRELDSDLILQLIIDMRREVQEIKEMLARVLLLSRYPHALPEQATYSEESQTTHPTLEAIERQQIRDILIETGGNRRKTASALGISERTLYRKIKEYGL